MSSLKHRPAVCSPLLLPVASTRFDFRRMLLKVAPTPKARKLRLAFSCDWLTFRLVGGLLRGYHLPIVSQRLFVTGRGLVCNTPSGALTNYRCLVPTIQRELSISKQNLAVQMRSHVPSPRQKLLPLVMRLLPEKSHLHRQSQRHVTPQPRLAVQFASSELLQRDSFS